MKGIAAYVTRQIVFSAVTLIVFGAFIALAWTGPTASPPNNNADAPINVGGTDQIKSGGLGVSVFTADSAGIVSGLPRLVFHDDDASLGASNPMWGIRSYDASGNFIIQSSTDGSAYTDRVTVDTSGNVTAAGFFHSSDARFKENIVALSGLDIITRLTGVSFNWKKDGAPSAGVIAQEVEVVLPEAVHTDAEGFKSVNYDALIAPLIEAIKEQQAEIDALKKEVEALKQKTQ